MRAIFVSVAFCICFSVSAQIRPVAASTADFASAEGAWKGSLTYLDYTSGKPFTMPANINLKVAYGERIILSYEYPKEPKANGNDTLIISKNGLQIDGAKITAREILEDGAIQIITDRDGFDGNDNRKAILRHVYVIGKTRFQSTKQVKFEGTDTWILRNEYLFSR